jgi:hypothetical protein
MKGELIAEWDEHKSQYYFNPIQQRCTLGLWLMVAFFVSASKPNNVLVYFLKFLCLKTPTVMDS